LSASSALSARSRQVDSLSMVNPTWDHLGSASYQYRY
jgi:hypothetical protein